MISYFTWLNCYKRCRETILMFFPSRTTYAETYSVLRGFISENGLTFELQKLIFKT